MDPYAHVLANPGSVSARKQLLAVWKQAGDPRAELLEAQLELWELESRGQFSTPRNQELRSTIHFLKKDHGRAWAGEIADLVSKYEFYRGLVVQVEVSGERFLEVAPRLFELAPIQHVILVAPLGDLGALTASPLLRKLVSINASGHREAFGDRGAVMFAKSPHVANLRWLALDDDAITEAGVESLAASPYLENVQYLSLERNPADPTPSVYSDSGFYWWDRPELAGRLESVYGPRPWLRVDNPEKWPPSRDDLAVTP